MNELAYDLIVGQTLSWELILKMFTLDNFSEYGEEHIGEHFIVCKDPENEDFVWSWMLIQDTAQGYEYRLIYKYTG